jgi:putative thioredoxin
MTQQPFSRPGAIDLSGLAQQRPPAQPSGPGGGPAPSPSGSYTVDVTEENFQTVLQASTTAPVALVFHSARQSPESTTPAAAGAGGGGAVGCGLYN